MTDQKPTLLEFIGNQTRNRIAEIKRQLITVLETNQQNLNNYIYGKTPGSAETRAKIIQVVGTELDFDRAYREHLEKEADRISRKLNQKASSHA